MRKASERDVKYIAECFINISRFIKSKASDIYVDGMPGSVDPRTEALASSYIDSERSIAYIVERDGKRVACIAARIEDTSFLPSGIGNVGNIAICWVEENYRSMGIGKALVLAVESWFLNKGINVVELSYLAQNSLAEKAWSGIGYKPFRVHSHKVLKNA